jgi:hypothetical protein
MCSKNGFIPPLQTSPTSTQKSVIAVAVIQFRKSVISTEAMDSPIVHRAVERPPHLLLPLPLLLSALLFVIPQGSAVAFTVAFSYPKSRRNYSHNPHPHEIPVPVFGTQSQQLPLPSL